MTYLFAALVKAASISGGLRYAKPKKMDRRKVRKIQCLVPMMHLCRGLDVLAGLEQQALPHPAPPAARSQAERTRCVARQRQEVAQRASA
jgi:hypothetical protein